MSADTQQIVALALVALAAIALVRRHRRRRKNPGCSGACSCPSEKLRH
jgi:hypothetical protein